MEHTFNATTDPLQHSFSGHALRFRQLSRTRLPAPLDDQGRVGRRRGGLQRRRERRESAGAGELNENWWDGLRQLASSAYPLSGVAVLPNRLVASVFLSKVNDALTATVVQLSNGTKLYASCEVLLAVGAYRTPQLLMLSGIGPKAVLKKRGIAPQVEAPQVGRGLMDHMLLVEM